MNGLTRADVETIAELAAIKAAAKVGESIDLRIKRHEETCPVASKIEIRFYKLLIMLTASGAIGGGAVGALMKLL